MKILGTSQGLDEADIRKESELLHEIKAIHDELEDQSHGISRAETCYGGSAYAAQKAGEVVE